MTDFQKQQELEQVWFELQRVRAVSRCQSVMSKYVFRLATGDLTGCADLWAKRDDSRVEMSWGVYDGYEGVRACYDKCHVENLGDMIGILPVHSLTTPVIEVAADGKTARGVWISPGFESHPDEATGKAGCNWAWMKYGVDFICEDGEWRLWHMTTYGLFMTDYYKSWGDTAAEGRERNALALLDELSDEAQPSRLPYHKDWNYAVDRAPDPEPVPPEKYRTWDEIGYGY